MARWIPRTETRFRNAQRGFGGEKGHSNNDACWLSDSINITQALLVLIGHYYDACLRSTLLRSIPNKLCKFLSDEYSLVYIYLSPRPGY